MLVLDRNLNIVTSEGADDLLNLEVEQCRSLWISLLNKQLAEAKNNQDDEDDE